MTSFLEKLRAPAALKPSDPWKSALYLLKVRPGSDRIERIATDALFDFLDIPPLQRTPEAAKRLRRAMVELGWTPMRVRSATARGRASRVRGYVRLRNF
jgi:hypothetical protein